MSAFDTVLTEIFDRGAEARLSREVERQQIALAQEGDEDATIALLYAYAPVLRAQAHRHASRLGVEEARATAVAGLIEAIFAFNLRDRSGQLAGIAWQHVSEALRENGGTVRIPRGTFERYTDVMRAAGGDVRVAEELAPTMKLSVETFRAVREALAVGRLQESDDAESSRPMIDRAAPVWLPSRDAVREDVRDMAHEALAALSGDPLDVVRFAYGFETGEAMSDEEVRRAIAARELGEDAVDAGESTMSRAKVQRIRKGALAEMKSALEGVA